MEAIKQEESSEEIVIVGTRYEQLADVVSPLYDKKVPIKKKDIARLFGSETLYLKPKQNEYDNYAVGVYNENMTLIGYVWAWQSLSIRNWLKENDKTYVPVNINRVNTQTELVLSTPTIPIFLGKTNRSEGIDMTWADDVPNEMTNLEEESQELGLDLLNDELAKSKKWSDILKLRIDNMLYYLRTNLSRQCYDTCMDIYQQLMSSSDERVREQGEWFLKTLVSKGSKRQIEWWVNEWLPEFMKKAYDRETLELYKASGYTLEVVESLLNDAPYRLYQMYKVNKYRFAKQLYYSALPQEIYYRLLTLLALRESLRESQGLNDNHNDKDELFRFIHPAMDEQEEQKIHNQIVKLVKRQGVIEICRYLRVLEAENKVLLPQMASVAYTELKRIGMPQGEGYGEKYFMKHYNKIG